MKIFANKFLLFGAFFMNFSLNTNAGAAWSGALWNDSTAPEAVPSSKPSTIGRIDMSQKYIDTVCLGKCDVKSETLEFSVDASDNMPNLFEINNNNGELLYAERKPIAVFTMPDFGNLDAIISLVSINSNSTEARKYIGLGIYKNAADFSNSPNAVIYMPNAGAPDNNSSAKISVAGGDTLAFVPLMSKNDLSAANASFSIGTSGAAVSGFDGQKLDLTSVYRISIEFLDETKKKIQ